MNNNELAYLMLSNAWNALLTQEDLDDPKLLELMNMTFWASLEILLDNRKLILTLADLGSDSGKLDDWEQFLHIEGMDLTYLFIDKGDIIVLCMVLEKLSHEASVSKLPLISHCKDYLNSKYVSKLWIPFQIIEKKSESQYVCIILRLSEKTETEVLIARLHQLYQWGYNTFRSKIIQIPTSTSYYSHPIEQLMPPDFLRHKKTNPFDSKWEAVK